MTSKKLDILNSMKLYCGSNQEKLRFKWRYVGFILIVFQLLVFIGIMTHHHLLINKKYPINRILLSADSTELTVKEQLIVKYIEPYMEKTTDAQKQVLTEYGDIIQQIYGDEHMNYDAAYEELEQNGLSGDSALLCAFENLVLTLIDKASDQENGLYNHPLALELSQILHSLGENGQNYPELLTNMIDVINVLATTRNEETHEYLEPFVVIAQQANFQVQTVVETAEEFEEVFRDTAGFIGGSIKPMLSMIQMWTPVIRYAVEIGRINRDELYAIIQQIPKFANIENRDQTMEPFMEFAHVCVVDSTEKKELLLRFVSLIADIDLSHTDDEKLIKIAAQIYADTHGTDFAAFMWNIWSKIVTAPQG